MDASQVAIVITAVGTCLAAIITALLGGTRWLLKVWFNYQLQVKKEEQLNNDKLVKEISAELKVHTKMLGEHKLTLELYAQKLAETDKKLGDHQEKLDRSIAGYASNIQSSERILARLKEYFVESEKWRNKIETEIKDLKLGRVIITEKK